MDSPPAKRRRTSPRLSGRSDDNDPDAADIAAEAPSSQPQSKIPRPSFASPTRASLSRHNPAILGRRESLPRSSQADDGGAGKMVDSTEGDESAPLSTVRPLAQPPIRSPSRSPARSMSPTRALAMPPIRSPIRRPSRSLSRSPTRRLFGSTGNALFGAPPQQSPKATRQHQPLPHEAQKLGSAASFPDRQLSSIPGSLLGDLPRRSPIKPVPRPLPPPDPQRSEDVLEPLIAREKRLRTGLDMFRVHEEHVPEPELPPTPKHPSPDLTTSPPGIHNQHQSSTPSRRPNRVGRLRGGNKSAAKSSSSPLKQPPIQGPAQDNSEPGQDDTRKRKPPLSGATVLKESDGNVPRRGPAQKGQPLPSESNSESRHNVRGIKPADPEADKKKERNEVMAEIRALEADIALAAAENERIREAVEEQGGSGSSMRSIPAAPNANAIVDLLRRRAVPEDEDDEHHNREEIRTVNWLQMAANPISFLPFGKPRANVAEAVQLFAGGSSSKKDQDLPQPISHHPIEMSSRDELPFLQAFTPLAFHSQIFALSESGGSASSDSPLLQKHIITASSTAPAGVFIARIEMTVNSKSLKIVDLHVPRIEPPEARIELQPLLDRVTGAAKNSTSSALVRNVTVLSWAMGEWVRVAVKRAKFWASLARLLGEKGQGMASAIRELKSRAKAAKAHKRGRQDDDNDDDLNGESNDPVSKREVLEHIGRSGMDVDIPALFHSSTHKATAAPMTGMRMEWNIDFDWTGEATSKMRLLVGVPGKWRKADKKGSLGKLPRLFDKMVSNGSNPMRAVQTVVALLAGEEGL